jgi:transposase
MRKIRDVLRLKHANGVSERQIAKAVGMARSTVADCLGRARVAGIGWPIAAGIDDAELERRLFPSQTSASPARPPPDWSCIHKELQRRSMTLQLMWEEYRGQQPEGYGYSRFCDLYSAWKRTISATMRQTHGPAEKLFVDFAGDTVPVIDPATGEVDQAHIFVAVLGASYA